MNLECPKCKTLLEQGYLTDLTRTQLKAVTWVKELKLKFLGGIKNEETLFAYKCSKCGHVELKVNTPGL